jgi:hypothetical protein
MKPKKISVYKHKKRNKSQGVIRTLKEGVDFTEYSRRQKEKGIEVVRVQIPSMKQLAIWSYDSICESIDDCPNIEPDGTCPHGYPSWLLALNMI